MAEGSTARGNPRKQHEERHNHGRFKYGRKEKREKFLEMLRDEGLSDDPFEHLSDDKIKEISDTIGRKREYRRVIPLELLRLELKAYYYDIKLTEVKLERRLLKHNWRHGKNYKTLHEESPESCGSASSLVDQYSDVPNKFTASELDSADDNSEHDCKDVQFKLDEGRPGQNQQFSKSTGEALATPTIHSDWTDQQLPTTINIADHRSEANGTTKGETSSQSKALPHFETLDADVNHQSIDEQVDRNLSGSPTGTTFQGIEDIQSEADIKTLSSRQLKEILRSNNVECNNICERKDLLILVQRLWEHIQEQEKEYSIASECVVCMNARINCAFLECGHMVACLQCGGNLKECPMCRNYITRAVRIFRC